MDSFLTERQIQLQFDGQQSAIQPLTGGIPQGSPISPILFLIYISYLVAKEGFQLSYIDDFSISVSSTSAAKNCKRLEEICRGLFSTAKEIGANFAAEKTELIHFSSKRTPITEGIIVGGTTIKPKPVIRWLGVYLDPKLSFKSHIQRKSLAASAAFSRISGLGNSQKGLPIAALRQLYITCVSTIADFGS